MGKTSSQDQMTKTIIIWTPAETGAVVSGPFRGRDHCVDSVSFSPDGKRVVSGSKDNTIRIWDIETGEVVSGAFRDNSTMSRWMDSFTLTQNCYSGSHPCIAQHCGDSNVCIMRPNPTRLDLGCFVHGTSWHSCRK